MLLRPITARTIRAARLGAAVLVLWDGDAPGSSPRPALDGAALPRPFATLALDGEGRRAALLRVPAAPPVARLDLAPGIGLALGDFGTDAAAMAAALPPPARLRLLRLLLEFGRGPLGLAAEPEFARLCLSLAPEAGALRPVAALGERLLLVAGPAAPRGTAAYLAGPGLVLRNRAAPAPDGLLLLDRPAAAAPTLLLAGPRGAARFRLDLARPVPPALAALAADPGLRRRLPAALHRADPSDPAVAALAAERALLPAAARRHAGPALAAALDLALPDGEGGLFLSGWTRDPLGLTRGLARPDGRTVPAEAVFRFAPAAGRGAEAPPAGALGFVAHLPDADPHPEAGVRLRLGSGAALDLTAPAAFLPPAAARDAVLGAVPLPAATGAMLDRCLRPAAARLHAAALRGRATPELVAIGQGPASPQVSVVIPLYRNLGFLRFQVAALASDPGLRRAEVLYVLDSPEQRAECEHLLRGLHAMHGMALRLAVMPANMGYGPANNDAARHARGRLLLLLNSDVVPAAPGWLARLAAPLEADRTLAATGPKLLFEDGSLQHAGLYFERDPGDGLWLNRHFHKGFPRAHAPACRGRPVPGVTGAALLVRRRAFEAVGGFDEGYVVGDYEDSDLCLKLRALGHGLAYVPEAELYHFERRSIRLHAGYTRTVASACNRRRHHERWDGAIEALMRGRRWA